MLLRSGAVIATATLDPVRTYTINGNQQPTQPQQLQASSKIATSASSTNATTHTDPTATTSTVFSIASIMIALQRTFEREFGRFPKQDEVAWCLVKVWDQVSEMEKEGYVSQTQIEQLKQFIAENAPASEPKTTKTRVKPSPLASASTTSTIAPGTSPFKATSPLPTGATFSPTLIMMNPGPQPQPFHFATSRPTLSGGFASGRVSGTPARVARASDSSVRLDTSSRRRNAPYDRRTRRSILDLVRKKDVDRDDLRRTLTSLKGFDLTERVIYLTDGPYLAGGAYGDIRIGECTVPGRGRVKVAVKCIRLYLHDNPEVVKLIEREVRLWSKLKHPNILPLLGYAIEEHGLPALISEFMDNGTVLKYVQMHPDCDVIRIVVGLAEGISYLHDSRIVHSDIKSDNVLVSQSGEPLICDFGVSRLIAMSQTMEGHGVQPQSTTVRGSARWMSPELFTSEDHAGHSKESDIWAFGMTVYELLARKRPYHHLISDPQVMFSIVSGKLPEKPGISQSWPESYHRLWDKCEECWSSKPQARPSASELALFMKTLVHPSSS